MQMITKDAAINMMITTKTPFFVYVTIILQANRKHYVYDIELTIFSLYKIK